MLVDDAIRVLVGQARAEGRTWAAIGEVLHVTRQAAFERFGADDEDDEGAVQLADGALPDAAGLVVRNLIGSEASRGGIEALLAGPYRPGAIMTALVSYVGGLAVGYWAGMTALAAAVLALLDLASGATLSLTVGYLSLVLVLPLLAAWSATSLSLLVNLLYPRLAQSGSIGISMGGGGLGTGAAILPALAVFVVFTMWTPHIAPGLLLAIAGSATAAIAVASTVIVTYQFRPGAVLES